LFNFKRHFNLIYLPIPSGQALKSIFHGTLEASMFYSEKSGLDSDLHTALIEASCSLLDAVNQVLKPCPTPGRQHYMFNMKTIITILQVCSPFSPFLKFIDEFDYFLPLFFKGLRKLSETQRNESLVVVSFWRDEIISTIGCQMTRYSDLNWLETYVKDLIKQVISLYSKRNS